MSPEWSRPRVVTLRVVSVLVVLLAGVFSYFTLELAFADPQETTATATVTYVHPGETHRRAYEVTFVTRHGERCESTVNSGFEFAEVTDQPEVGDVVEVRYQRGSQPCALVREANDEMPFLFYAFPFIFLVVGIVATYVSWWRLPRRAATQA